MENSTKVICVGYLEKGTGKHQSNAVYKKKWIMSLSYGWDVYKATGYNDCGRR